ncbi:unnamed protein product [Effrenium voratum]|nr:unnamed protein product [Effrenium voratum]
MQHFAQHLKAQLMLIYDKSMAVDFLRPVSAAANNYIVSGKYYMYHGLSRVALVKSNLHRDFSVEPAKVQQFQHLAFKSIRDTSKPAIDWLQTSSTATIIAVSEDGNQILTDQDIEVGHLNTCRINDVPALVCGTGPCTYQVDDTDILLVPGQHLQCDRHLTTEDEIHQELTDFWTTRWNTLAELPAEAWNRFTGFTRAYVPAGCLALPDLQLHTWEAALNHFSERSARGPDGIHAADLKAMPSPFKAVLLDHFRGIEAGAPWPEQLLQGLATGIAKVHDATNVDQFRPIVVLNMTYRAWSSIRSRQILKLLEPLLDFPSFGFLPTRETKQLWLPLQGLIELSSQQHQSLLGHVADICKAFNCLPRRHVQALALHIGLPRNLVGAWHRFLGGLHRHFRVRDTVGPPISSNNGYPEGCGMSCLAMVIVSWCYHTYQSIYAPNSIALSYVDNLEQVASNIGDLMTSIITQDSFMELFQLATDHNKTYAWALQARDRSFLQQLRLEVVDHAKDLDGLMT